MATFDPTRVERMIAALAPKPCSRLVLNVNIEEPWMLDVKEEIMKDLLHTLRAYPPGTYQVGIIANHVMKDWQYVDVGLKQPHNVMTAYPFYIGTVEKVA